MTPWIFTSGIPPAFELITGTSQAMASNAARPKLSDSLGNMNRSPMLKISSMASCFPRNVTQSQVLNSLETFSICERSGPSPMSSNFAGISLMIWAKTAMTSSIRLTFLKFEV